MLIMEELSLIAQETCSKLLMISCQRNNLNCIKHYILVEMPGRKFIAL